MNKKYIKKSAFLAMAISAVLMGSTTNVYADSTEDRLSKVEALVETKAAQGAVDSLEQRKANKTDLENLKNKVEQKAEKCEVDALKEKVEKKADKSYVDDELKKKADKSQVDALEQKVEQKVDQSKFDEYTRNTNTTLAGLARDKANKEYVDDELKKKADKSDLEKETKERKEADAQLASNVNELQGEIKSVASMSAALAALKPLNYNPNAPLQIMTGYGHYRGKSATALGIAYYKNENNLFHMGVSYAGNKNVAANAGVTWSIGSGVSRSMHTDAVTNAELMALQNKVHQFEERDQMQQEMIESMQKQIAELTEMMMMNK
ncbi:YadA C-terminal domain-containing protein [Dialister pneumosintes]|nr:YadA C-terminal domain-containing protein [Dialister pneumosintes]